MEIESIKKTQTEGILEMKNLGKRTGTTDSSITRRILEFNDEGISYPDVWDTIKAMLSASS